MHGTRPRGDRGTGAGAVETRPYDPLDDWLGDVSDDDWSEEATERAQRARAVPSYGELEPERRRSTSERPPPARGATPADAHRAAVERRRIAAGIVVAAILGLVAVIAFLLLRGGNDATEPPPVTVPTSTAPAPETTPSSTPTTTAQSATTPSSTTPSSTTPSAGGTSGFTLPEGTKLQVGAENDPALVRELQVALTSAGYNPGTADGVYGEQTEEAVVAFQQDNGLSADGRVGPETAAALNSALAGG